MKIKTIIIGLFLISILVLSGCTQQTYVCFTGEQVENSALCPICGDNKCTGLESTCNCPSDCYSEPDGRRTIPKSCPFGVYDPLTGGCINVDTGCIHYDWNN